MKKENKKTSKVNKPIFKRWWFWLIIVLIVIAIFTPTTNSTTGTSQQPTITEKPVEAALSFVLMDNELGDYGREVVLNKETEFEEHEIAYYIPSGIYTVSNLNDNGGAQVSVYSGLPVKNGEWEEFVMDDNCPKPIVVMAGETKELDIKDGQFVVLADGISNIQFTMK